MDRAQLVDAFNGVSACSWPVQGILLDDMLGQKRGTIAVAQVWRCRDHPKWTQTTEELTATIRLGSVPALARAARRCGLRRLRC